MPIQNLTGETIKKAVHILLRIPSKNEKVDAVSKQRKINTHIILDEVFS